MANQGDWTCLDCRDVVAHVFTPTARTYYDLEDLYRECDEVGLPFETERTHDGFYAEEDGDFYERGTNTNRRTWKTSSRLTGRKCERSIRVCVRARLSFRICYCNCT